MSKLKRALMNLIMEFNNLMTDKASLYWNEETDIQEGYEVFVDGEGNEKILHQMESTLLKIRLLL